MTATIMIHNGEDTPIADHLIGSGVDTGVLRFGDGKGTICNVFMPVAKAFAMADCWKDRPSYYDLLAFIEEVRDCRPDLISGRARDPQDDVADMIEADVLLAFQADAEALIGKKGEPHA